MMRMQFLVGALALSAVGGSSHACRIGQEVMVFAERPSPPNGERHSSIAKAELISRGPSPAAAPEAGRGYLVASAHVSDTVRGPQLPASLPIYLPGISSCTVHSPSGINTSGYIVGRLREDARGPFLEAATRKDPPGIW